ncbi:tetratricopeptide repeat protein [Aurantiacibacter odishensis]|uniref:tetratricopeptide repeat protein n=1 Tax=Aurantiacibacter odishensis TaxID=1155476 RepID=UPI000E76C261|nr:tetratricopeptide repeat protein [Aurantiacibacter odishensis]
MSGGSTGEDPVAAKDRTHWRGLALKALALSGAAVLVVAGADAIWGGGETAIAAVNLPPASFGSGNFGEELASADRRMSLANERVEIAGPQWLPLEALARAQLARFKLTADPAELAAATSSIKLASTMAPEGAGPLLSSAEIAMAGHDLDGAQASLDALETAVVPPSRTERATAAALRGDIAFYRGDMAAAQAAYQRADDIEPTSGTAVRRALLHRSQGQFDEAIRLLVEASRRDSLRTPRGMASYALQIGMVESARGNFAAAAERFREADRLFPGHWLTHLYIAEAQGVAGKFDEAIATQERIAEAMGDPQAMDAAASLYLAQGDEASARQLTIRSARIWRERAEMMPMAYIAHAFENELAFGDPERALALALENLSHRPYGDAHILVAEAMLETNRPAEARAHLMEAEAQGWRSAPLYARLSDAEKLLGNEAAADEAAQKARELNPHIFDPVMGRLWFGHG